MGPKIVGFICIMLALGILFWLVMQTFGHWRVVGW